MSCASRHREAALTLSPVNTALAPAMKHIACSASVYEMRPAAKRTIEVGSTIRAVAITRRRSWIPMRSLPSSGVPGMATSALTGNDSGASGSLEEEQMSVDSVCRV